MALPRDVLQWLRSLELMHPVSKPMRDLANGIAVVEILSKYFPREFQMYRFSNGVGSKARKFNWEKIDRISAKLGLPMPSRLCDGTANQRTDAAILLLIYLYEHLTGRMVRPFYPIQNPFFLDLNYQYTLPRYQRCTLVHAIKANLKIPEVQVRRSRMTQEDKINFLIDMFRQEQKYHRRLEMVRHIPTLLERTIRKDNPTKVLPLLLNSRLGSESREVIGDPSTSSSTRVSKISSTRSNLAIPDQEFDHPIRNRKDPMFRVT